MAAALSGRGLGRVALAGVACSIVVVAASAFLRLGTRLDAGGNALSMLPPGLASSVRLAHRVCASAAGLAALAAVILALRARPVTPPRRLALAAVVGATAILAAIGPLTPGYRLVGVTVANATLGVALASAFAWLWADARGAHADGTQPAALLVVLALLAEIALGTAASAQAMQGRLAFEPLHVALGPVAAALAAWAAIRHGGWIAALAVVQMGLGMALAAMGASRGVASEWAHAMLACALCVVLAARGAAGPARRAQ